MKDFVRRLDREEASGKSEPAGVHLQTAEGGRDASGLAGSRAAAAPAQLQALSTAPAGKACMHAEAGEESTSVVRTKAIVLGLPVTAVIDSGASHSCISQIVARKLRLMHLLERTETSFLTAGGSREKPWGILRDVPVQVGKLKLTLDPILVTAATNYSLLLGNDFMSQAAANLSWSDKKLGMMLSPDEYDEVDVEYMSRRRAPASRLTLLELDETPSESGDSAAEQSSLDTSGAPAEEGPGQGIDEESDQPAGAPAAGQHNNGGSWESKLHSPTAEPERCTSPGPSDASPMELSATQEADAPFPASDLADLEEGSISSSPPPNGTLVTMATAYDCFPPAPTLSNKFTYRPLREISVEFESHFIPDGRRSSKSGPAVPKIENAADKTSDWDDLSPAPTEEEMADTCPSPAPLQVDPYSQPATEEASAHSADAELSPSTNHTSSDEQDLLGTTQPASHPGPHLFLTCLTTSLEGSECDGSDWSYHSEDESGAWDGQWEEAGEDNLWSMDLTSTDCPFRLGQQPLDPGDGAPELFMTHHDAISEPWAGTEWVTVHAPPAQLPKPHSPAASSVADWRAAREERGLGQLSFSAPAPDTPGRSKIDTKESKQRSRHY